MRLSDDADPDGKAAGFVSWLRLLYSKKSWDRSPSSHNLETIFMDGRYERGLNTVPARGVPFYLYYPGDIDLAMYIQSYATNRSLLFHLFRGATEMWRITADDATDHITIQQRQTTPRRTITLDDHARVVATGLGDLWQTLTSAANAVAVDLNIGHAGYHLLTENTTVGLPTNPLDGTMLRFVMAQGAGNSFTLDFNAAFKHTLAASYVVTAEKWLSISFQYRTDTWYEIAKAEDMD